MHRWQFWVLAAAWYITLIYSVGLSIGFGPEQTIATEYWTNKPIGGSYGKMFADQGSLHAEGELDSAPWKLSSFYGDAGFYLLQAAGQQSIAPYRYRFLPPALVQVLSAVSGCSLPFSFALFNAVCTFLTALLFTWYLLDSYKFSQLLALLGGTMSIAMLPSVRTLAFPMVDPAAHLMMLIIVYAVVKRNVALFFVASIVGIATKETTMVGAVLWFLASPCLSSIPVAVVPVLAFMLVRVAMGGEPLEVNYGFNVLAGELPWYGSRVFDAPLGVLKRIVEAFGPLWIGLIYVPRHRLLREQVAMVPLVVVATVVLSYHIARPLGVLFPVVLPAALLFLQGNEPDTCSG